SHGGQAIDGGVLHQLPEPSRQGFGRHLMATNSVSGQKVSMTRLTATERRIARSSAIFHHVGWFNRSGSSRWPMSETRENPASFSPSERPGYVNGWKSTPSSMMSGPSRVRRSQYLSRFGSHP